MGRFGVMTFSMTQHADLLGVKQALYDGLNRLAETPINDMPEMLTELFAQDCQWRVVHPINELSTHADVLSTLWAPLKNAMPDLERRNQIFVGGVYQQRTYIASVGTYCGTFRRDWLTIPATGRPVYLRFGEVYQVENGKIVQANLIWDLLDLMRQAGFWPIAPSLGTEGMWAAPYTADGIVLHKTDAAHSAGSLAQTLAMHQSLFSHNDRADTSREGLLKMAQREYWHPKMMWYGPSGIGTTRTLQGFVDYHQLPFRQTFPDRTGGAQWEREAAAEQRKAMGGGHYIRIGDGPYSVTGGWPSVFSLHTGGSLFGLGPTGQPIQMRVMDFYLHHEGLIRENWVPIDVIYMLLQMGVDVFARMQTHFNRGRAEYD